MSECDRHVSPEDATASRGRQPIGKRSRYDAFISYSHECDRDLARSLEKTLGTFGRRWYQIRGLRIYRDETNLAAESDLWSPIESALHASSSMLLLASPESRESDWVHKEVRSFVDARGLGSLCIVQTKGLLPWTEKLLAELCLDQPETAVSREVYRLFHSAGATPMVADLRDFRGLRHRDRARNKEYLARVASLAAKVLDVDKEAIWGDYHRARRTRAMVFSAVSLLLLVLLLSTLRYWWGGRVLAEHAETDRLVEAAGSTNCMRQDPSTVYALLGTAARYGGKYGRERAERAGFLAESHHPIATVVQPQGRDFRSFAVDPLSKLVAMGMVEGMVTLADIETGARRVLGERHTEAVDALAWSDDGQLLASGSSDAVMVWHRTGASPARILVRPGSPIAGLSFSSRTRRRLLVASWTATEVWDLDSGRRVFNLGNDQVAPFPSALSAEGDLLATVSKSGSVTVHNLEDGSSRAFGESIGRGDCVVFSPDGALLATAGKDGDKHFVRVWRIATGQTTLSVQRHWSLVKDLVFSKDGSMLAIVSPGKELDLWDPETGTSRQTLRLPSQVVNSVSFSGSGAHIAIGSTGGSIGIWASATGTLLHKLDGHQKPVQGLTFLGTEDALLSVSSDHTIWSWRIPAHSAPDASQGGVANVTHLAMSTGRATFVIAGNDGRVEVWNSETRSRVGNPIETKKREPSSMALLPSGNTLAIVSKDDGASLWDLKNGEEIRKLPLPTETHPSAVGVGSVGGNVVVAVGAYDGSLSLFTEEGTMRKRLPGSYTESVDTIAFSARGDAFLTSNWMDKVELWKVRQGSAGLEYEALPALQHGGSVNVMAFSPDGSLVVTGCGDGKVRVWDASNGGLTNSVLAHATGVEALTISPDGKHIATAGSDNAVKLWRVGGHLSLRSILDRRRGTVKSLKFLNASLLFSQTSDGLQLWDTVTGALLRSHDMSGVRTLPALAYPEKRRVLVIDHDGLIRFWDINLPNLDEEVLSWGRRTNLRVCRRSLSVVPVLPYPPFETVWADTASCEELSPAGL